MFHKIMPNWLSLLKNGGEDRRWLTSIHGLTGEGRELDIPSLSLTKFCPLWKMGMRWDRAGCGASGPSRPRGSSSVERPR